MRNRRRFMVGLASLPLAIMVDQTRVLPGIPRSSHYSAPNLQMLWSVFENPEEARVVGYRFLKLYQNEGPLGSLMSKIFRIGHTPWNERLLRAYLDTRKRLDFENADVVSVDGWVLSATEARVCAVVALTGKEIR